MFVIRLADGEEVHGECDELTINPATGVLTVCRVDGVRGNHHALLAVGVAVGDTPQAGVGVRPSLVSTAQ